MATARETAIVIVAAIVTVITQVRPASMRAKPSQSLQGLCKLFIKVFPSNRGGEGDLRAILGFRVKGF